MVMYTFDWGGANTSPTAFVSSGTTASLAHIWSNPGTYQVTATATDSKGSTSGSSISLAVSISPNNRPDTPILLGPATGTRAISYGYSAAASDPDKDRVKYTFDWGDLTTTTTTLVNSGSSACASHAWNVARTYQVKVRATGSKGAISEWSNHWDVTILGTSGSALGNASSECCIEPDTNASILTNPPIDVSGSALDNTSSGSNPTHDTDVRSRAQKIRMDQASHLRALKQQASLERRSAFIARSKK